jgi:Flp pilus assembly protein TadG
MVVETVAGPANRLRALLRSTAEARRGWAGASRAQSLAELALSLPLLLVLAVGVADFGRVFYALVSVENSARQAARYAASHYSADEPAFASAEALGTADALGAGLDNAVTVVVAASRGGSPVVSASVSHQFSLATGLLGLPPFEIAGTAEMVVLEGN